MSWTRRSIRHLSAAATNVDVADEHSRSVPLAGLPTPKGPQSIDGDSMVNVLRGDATGIGKYAYHCFPGGGRLGRAIRTQRYRLVEWKPFGSMPPM